MNIMEILKASMSELKKALQASATKQGDACWLFEPEIKEGKVCIVAHIDTIFDDDGFRFLSDYRKKQPQKKKKIIIHDAKKGLICSPDGLGADDRAGVYAALKIFNETPEPHKPYILFTDFEESGGYGAQEAAALFGPELSGITMFIELDRRGEDDAVFYNGEPDEFIEYIEGFGFGEEMGSFSDISHICPAVKVCGVNLSIGYYHQHSKHEYLDINAMNKTIDRVQSILKDNYEAKKVWELETPDRDWWSKCDGDYEDVVCPKCGEAFFEEQVEMNQGNCIACGSFIERDCPSADEAWENTMLKLFQKEAV